MARSPTSSVGAGSLTSASNTNHAVSSAPHVGIMVPLTDLTVTAFIKDIYWAAGFIEGEGSFYFMDRRGRAGVFHVRVPQVQKEPLERLQRIFGGSMYFRPSKNPRHSDQWVWRTIGERSAGIAMTLYAVMSPRRKEQIRVALSRWRKFQSRKHAGCNNGHPWREGSYYIFNLKRKDGSPRQQRVCKVCCNARVNARRARLRQEKVCEQV